MVKKYAFKDYNPENMARVYGSDLSISPKHAIEICTALRNKTLENAKILLNDAISMKKPIHFRRFSHGAGHKKGRFAAAKFPVKAASEILKLINSLESNAQQKGLNSAGLILIHTSANRASTPMHYGRQGGRAMKKTHIQLIAEEKEVKKKSKNTNTESKPQKTPVNNKKIQQKEKNNPTSESKSKDKPEVKE